MLGSLSLRQILTFVFIRWCLLIWIIIDRHPSDEGNLTWVEINCVMQILHHYVKHILDENVPQILSINKRNKQTNMPIQESYWWMSSEMPNILKDPSWFELTIFSYVDEITNFSGLFLDKWINLAILWSKADGLSLLINGMDLNAHSVRPKTRYKEYQPPSHLLIGRFDTDDSSHWLTPAEAEAASSNPSTSGIPIFWEMSHFAFSEMTYVSRKMTAREYAHLFGFLGNEMLQKNSMRLWFGLNILDPPVSDLLLASQIGAPLTQFGAHATQSATTFVAEYKSDWRAVILGQNTVLRLGPLDPNGCPGNLKKCKDVS